MKTFVNIGKKNMQYGIIDQVLKVLMYSFVLFHKKYYLLYNKSLLFLKLMFTPEKNY